MESIILTGKVTGIEQSIIAGARSAEKALTFRPKIDASGFNRLYGPLGRLNAQASEFNKSLEASNARVLAFGASAGAIFAVQSALQAVIRDAIQVEKVLADINSVLNQSSSGLAKFADEIFKAAKNTGTTFQVASEAALELSRQGLSAEATVKRLNAALVLARLGGLDAKDAVEGLTSAINSFNKEALDDVVVVNKLANVSAKFAVSEKDLTEALKRSASAASDAGVSFDQLVALVTAAQQTTARGGAVIGNSLKTIFTRLQRSDTLEQLQGIGVAVRNVNGELLSAPQILKNLALVYDGLGQEQRAFISELVGGVFQINQLKAQLNDLGKEYGFYQRALEESGKSTDEAIRRNEELNKTTAASLNALRVTATEFSAAFGSEVFGPAIKNIEKLSETLLKSLQNVGKQDSEQAGFNIGEGIIKGIAGALSGPGVALLGVGLTAVFLRLGSFAVEAGKAILDNVRGVERQRQVQAEIQQILAASGTTYQQLIAGAKSLEEVEKRILAVVREQIALRNSTAALTSNLSPGLIGGGGFSMGQKKLNNAGLNFKGGRIQTFADPVEAAIQREKAKGVPASSIYVDSDPRLKSPQNPMGLLVANKRDEPLGGFQGVNRAIAMGIDPKKHGGGFVPNFVEAFPGSEFRAYTGRGKESRFINRKQADAINAAIKLYEEALVLNAQGLKTEAKERKLVASTILKTVNLTTDYNKILDKVTVEYKEKINEAKTSAKLEKERLKAGRRQYSSPIGPEVPISVDYESPIGPIFSKPAPIPRIIREQSAKASPEAYAAMLGKGGMGSAMNIPVGLLGQGTSLNSLKGQIALTRRDAKVKELLDSVQETIKNGGRLSKAQLGGIDAAAFRSAINSPEFEGFTTAQIKADPTAKRLLDKKIRDFQDQIYEKATAIDFDKTLSSVFVDRSKGLRGIFGTGKGDISAVEKALKRRLTDEERLATELRSQELGQRRSGRLTGYGIAGSFAASALASSGVLGDGKLAGGLQGAATGASLGAFFGPIGLAAGAGGGALIGALLEAGKEGEKAFQKAAEKYKQLAAELNNNISSLQQYTNIQSQLNDLIKSGNAKESDITTLNRQLTELFSNISDNATRKEILDAAGNVEKLNQALDRLAEKNFKDIARENVNLMVANTNAQREGSILGFGGAATSKNLDRIGKSLADASDLTKEEIQDLEKQFNSLRSGGKIEDVAKALEKFGLNAKEVKTDLNGLLIILRSALDGKLYQKALQEEQSIRAEYLLKLQEYNKTFKQIVEQVENTRKLAEAKRASETRAELTKASNNLRVSGYGATELSIFERQKNISINSLIESQRTEKENLDTALRGQLIEFAKESLVEGKAQKDFLATMADPTVSVDVLKELQLLNNLGDKDLKESTKAKEALKNMTSSFLYSLEELAIKQNEQTDILKNQLEVEKELLRRRDLASSFGGANALGQELDTSNIRKGFKAGAAVNISDRILRRQGYMSKLDRYNAEFGSRGARIDEAKGFIELGQLLPEGLSALRGGKTGQVITDKITKANELDLLAKNNKVLVSSLQGFFEGEFAAGGIFAPGGENSGTGEGLQRRIFEALQKSNGGRDFSELQKIINQSSLGIRSPEQFERLKQIINTAAEFSKKIPDAAKAQTENQFKTELQKEQESITRFQTIADNTKATVEAVKELKTVFEKQFESVIADKELGKANSVLETLKGELNNELKKPENFKNTRYIASDSSLNRLSYDFVSRAEQSIPNFQRRLVTNNSLLGVSDDLASEIGKGGSVEEILNRAQRLKGIDLFKQQLTPDVGKQDEELKNFIFKFAPDSAQEFYKKLQKNTEEFAAKVKEQGEVVDGLKQAAKAAQDRLNEFLANNKPPVRPIVNPVSTAPVFDANTKLNDQNRYGVGNALANLQTRTAIAREVTKYQSSYSPQQRDAAAQKKIEAEGMLAEKMKAAIEQGGIAAATALNDKLIEALDGASDALKIQTENKLQGAFKVVIEDNKATMDEITKLQKQIEDAIKEIIELKNKDRRNSGQNTTPSSNIGNASGASR